MPFETVALKTVEYLAVPSVVGHEGHFFKYLKQDFEKLGLTTHQHEGILEVCGSNPTSNIISAHVDRHGLISVDEGRYAYAAQHVLEGKYGEENIPSRRTLEAISKRFEGEIVLAYDPNTGDKLGEGTIKSCEASMDNGDSIFYIDGMKPMPKDTPVGYARSTVSNGDVLKGQIDNVVSLGIIYALFQNGFQGTALLSAEEEIGKSWIHIQNWLEKQKIETQELVIIDTSPYRETGPTDNGMVVLRNRDKSAEFNPELVQKIKLRCEDLDLPYQVKDEYFLGQGLKISDLGSTELGRLIQNSNGKFSGATVQIPTMEYHTSYETTSKGCIENFYTLLQSVLITDSVTSTKT